MRNSRDRYASLRLPCAVWRSSVPLNCTSMRSRSESAAAWNACAALREQEHEREVSAQKSVEERRGRERDLNVWSVQPRVKRAWRTTSSRMLAASLGRAAAIKLRSRSEPDDEDVTASGCAISGITSPTKATLFLSFPED
eukprot:1042413-Rhodomonas_salina.2